MKVGELSSILKENQTLPFSEYKKDLQNGELIFKGQFYDAAKGVQDQYIKDIKDKIIEQGEILSKRVDIKELKKYRELISEFLGEVVKSSYQFDKENTFDARGRHKVYMTIQKVNKQLDELSKQIVNEQRDTIEILNNIDTINGLIINMLI